MITTKFQQKVYNKVKRVPRGMVATYVSVARAIGRPRAFRAVGNALNKNPFRNVPCHRVVRSDGRIGGYAQGTFAKERRLRLEGVEVRQKRVDLKKFLYDF